MSQTASPSSSPPTSKGTHWNTSNGFLFACIGAAVGLGNIWKFPSMAGEQGGGAFVLVYLASIFVIAIPIAAAELAIGRRGQSDAVGSVVNVSHEAGYSATQSRLFGWIGTIGMLGSLVLLTFYAVIAGWVSYYLFVSIGGGIVGLDAGSAKTLINDLLADPTTMIFHQFLFLAIIGVILMRDLVSGLERANIVMIPALIIMLVALALYGAIAGDIGAALKFMFTPDVSKITPEVIQKAVGHGFFSVGVGAAMLLTYGAYIDKSVNLGKAAITIGLADTAIALLAGIAIFSIVFAQEGLSPNAGPTLIFETLPTAFTQIPYGGALAVIFFVLVYFAALTSGLSLGEVVVRRIENALSLSRGMSVYLSLGVIFIIGLASVFSSNIWSHIEIGGRNLFDAKDYLVTAYLMPLGGLTIVTFAGWAIPSATLRTALGSGNLLFTCWLWAARVLAPLGIIWMGIANL
ncbi:MAG: sodium-dependent transporter [Alphaproteobacteria bacterium]|nr:sodium-dependent transporter [Alphaproteobacteria bacterium]